MNDGLAIVYGTPLAIRSATTQALARRWSPRTRGPAPLDDRDTNLGGRGNERAAASHIEVMPTSTCSQSAGG